MGNVTAWRAARLADLASLELGASRRNLSRLITQLGSYPGFTLLLTDRPVAIVSLAPAGGNQVEMALICHRRLAGMVGRTAALRQIMVRAAGMLPHMDAVMRISDHNPAGQKIARYATFHPTGELIAGTSVRTWIRPALFSEKLTPDALPYASAPLSTGNR